MVVYSDSDYAGCSETQRSTIGSIVFLRNNDMSVPISFVSKRQSSVSRSIAEAEIVAMDSSLRILTLLVVSIIEELFLETSVSVHGDNQSVICVLKTSRSPTMRHLSRTHRGSIAWLHDQYHRNRFDFRYVRSEEMAADIFTNSMPAPHRWKQARRLINVIE